MPQAPEPDPAPLGPPAGGGLRDQIRIQPSLRCPLCLDGLSRSSDAGLTCPACRTPHHRDCWAELGGCATLGCAEQATRPASLPASAACPACRESLGPTPRARTLACPTCQTRHHRSCWRREGGCAVSGCHTGRARPTPRPARAPAGEADERLAAWASGIALALAWLSVPLLWLVGVPIVGLTALWVRSRSRRWLKRLLLASPFVLLPLLNVLGATAGYWLGNPSLRTAGLVRHRMFDPAVRAPIRSSGCMVDGSEILTQFPHNLTLHTWAALCGPLTRTLRSAVPANQEEAEAALAERGRPVLPREVRSDSLLLGSEELPFPRWVPFFPEEVGQGPELRVVEFSEDCVLLESRFEDMQHWEIHVIARAAGRVIHTYELR